MNEGSGRSSVGSLLNRGEEEELRHLAATPNVYQTLSKSIAPSIFGSTDIKKAITCLLFGGSRKRWVDLLGSSCIVSLIISNCNRLNNCLLTFLILTL